VHVLPIICYIVECVCIQLNSRPSAHCCARMKRRHSGVMCFRGHTHSSLWRFLAQLQASHAVSCHVRLLTAGHGLRPVLRHVRAHRRRGHLAAAVHRREQPAQHLHRGHRPLPGAAAPAGCRPPARPPAQAAAPGRAAPPRRGLRGGCALCTKRQLVSGLPLESAEEPACPGCVRASRGRLERRMCSAPMQHGQQRRGRRARACPTLYGV
jgi:hypothetical protein